ncbi:MAG: hypothetical protein GEU73_01165 [Chloroflexi bacterium]|nr:hypothetical protein [Chloroflexota bacterium]
MATETSAAAESARQAAGFAAVLKPVDGHISIDSVAGVQLEVRDLAEARAFYEPIFWDAAGSWKPSARTLTFESGSQSLELVQKAKPRTFADGGQHTAYRVRATRVSSLAEQLAEAGHSVEWWHEDHPQERELAPYLHDPSGNRVQLVAASSADPLIAHVAIEVHAFDYCEYLYVRELGGEVDYYHGWRVEDQTAAKAWLDGDDPAAPWTRRDNPGWTDFRDQGSKNRSIRVPRPNTQVFLRYGDTRLGMISATKTRQEPPEEQIVGTPRILFRSSMAADQAAARADAEPVPHERHGRSIYFRDADGNFSELRCG